MPRLEAICLPIEGLYPRDSTYSHLGGGCVGAGVVVVVGGGGGGVGMGSFFKPLKIKEVINPFYLVDNLTVVTSSKYA